MDDKKTLYVTVAIVILLCIIGGIWYMSNSSVKRIKIDYGEDTISFSDAKVIEEKVSKGYSYYQLYVFPKKYTLKCEGDFGGCKTIEENSSQLSTHSLHFTGKKLEIPKDSTKEVSKVVLPISFDDKEANKVIMKNIFTNLFASNNTTIPSSQENSDKEGESVLQSSQMFQMCKEQIEMAIPLGTLDRSITIDQKVGEECSGMNEIDTVQLAFGGLNDDDKSTIKLSLAIEEFTLEYRFFSLEEGEYILESTENKDIEKTVEISGEFDLRELIMQ